MIFNIIGLLSEGGTKEVERWRRESIRQEHRVKEREKTNQETGVRKDKNEWERKKQRCIYTHNILKNNLSLRNASDLYP